jgi:hypothetical protein
LGVFVPHKVSERVEPLAIPVLLSNLMARTPTIEDFTEAKEHERKDFLCQI